MTATITNIATRATLDDGTAPELREKQRAAERVRAREQRRLRGRGDDGGRAA